MQPKTENFIIGIDEAGRGPLAGPVVVAGIRLRMLNSAFRMPKGNFSALSIRHSELGIVKDSKKLSPKKREEWFRVLTSHPDISWVVAKVWPKKIDQINIARATNLAALRVYRKLLSTNYGSRTNMRITNSRIRRFVNNSIFADEASPVLLDGGLKLPSHIPHSAIIKGDERVPVISAASIIAKVTRDRIMVRLHKKFPQYRFDVHKGYGTRLHRQLIGQYGYSKIHRKSFRAAIELA